MSSYNYVVTAHKPTNVTHSVVGNFTAPNEINLIVAKCTRIEIHLLTPDGIKALLDVPIYGRIATLEIFKPPREDQDLLFISTERHKFAVLAYDRATGELVTKAGGDVQDRIGRPTDNGQIGIVDPNCRLIGLHLYDGLFKVIPIDPSGQLHDAFNIRLEELNVITIKFLFGCPKPTIAILYQDTKSAKHIRTYAINLRDKEFEDGPWHHSNLDMGASMIIPVPTPIGGAIVVGEQTIVYFDGSQTKVIPMQQTIPKAYGIVDQDGSRYLLSDITGKLHLLVLVQEPVAEPQSTGQPPKRRQVVGLKLEQLGKTSVASTLSYLDNGVVFVGSSFGDSQLVRLSATSVGEDPDNYVETLDTFGNLGPIVDFSVVDLEHQGQGQVVTCSGVYSDGSLRVIRNGIGINEQASVDLPGVKGMWSLKGPSSNAFDSHLVVTFIGETRVLAINDEDELDETEIAGLDAEAQTILCANIGQGGQMIAQVTPHQVRLVDVSSHMCVDTWTAPDQRNITAAAASTSSNLSSSNGSNSELLVALSGGNLVCLGTGGGDKLRVSAEATLPAEISCLDIGPRGDPENPNTCKLYACVGLWNMDVCLFALPSLEAIHKEHLGGDTIPRSVLLSCFEGVLYAMVALGDGQLYHFILDENTNALRDRKKLSLGTQPLLLKMFTSSGANHVFAASDRPTVIYSSNRKLLYSNVNLREVSHITSFNSEAFPECLAFIQGQTMVIGTIDQIQKLHIRSIPLGEQPRRICHQDSSHTFAVLTVRSDFDAPGNDSEANFVRLIDDQTFETLSRFQLETYEQACSILSCTFDKDPTEYFLVGTAHAPPDEVEPTRGRIIVLIARGSSLEVVATKEVKGAVYNLNAFNGKLLAAINSKVQLYRWTQRREGSAANAPAATAAAASSAGGSADGAAGVCGWELVSECGHQNHILALYVETRGDFIVVGDLMKSISLLVYKPEEGTIEDLAFDFNTNWMTAVQILDDDTFLGGENSFNLFTVKRNSDCATDEDRQRLDVVGQYHLGEFVNKFRQGSLVMQLPDSEASSLQTLIFGTVNGVIGIIASLPQQKYETMMKLQKALNEVVKGVGGFSHDAWRSFYNERKTEKAINFVDGDLVETFLDLKKEQMDQIAHIVEVDCEDLCKQVEELARLH